MCMKKSIVIYLAVFGAAMSHAMLIEQTDYRPVRRAVTAEPHRDAAATFIIKEKEFV